MNRRAITRALPTVLLVASSLFFAPSNAGASGPESTSCSGTSSSAPLSFTSSTVICTGAPDDNGTYTFRYALPLDCSSRTGGTFKVVATGGEPGLAGSGSYTVNPLISITATFTYTALDTILPPVETHLVQLQITCVSGATTGVLAE
jgi:hypothetical protein